VRLLQLLVFYMYFVYNVANPFIYAFLNQAFREDLKKLLKRS
jgi:cholecystokinin A receptor/hypocretin (orexin) receptor 2